MSNKSEKSIFATDWMKRIKTPEEIFQNVAKWLDSNKKLAFFVTMVLMVITNFTVLTDFILSQDGIWNSMEYFRPEVWEVKLGRWGIILAEWLHGFVAIPTITTFMGIAIISLSSMFIIDIFDFKDKLSVIITSMIIAVAPTFAVTFLFAYTSFAYCVGFLLAILSVWSIYKLSNRRSVIYSVIFFVLSLSIYQSNIGIPIGLCIMISIIELLYTDKKIKDVFITIFKMIICMIVGTIVYFLTTKILLSFLDLDLAMHGGLNEISILSIVKGLKSSILKCYFDCYNFYFDNDIVLNAIYKRDILYLVMLVITLLCLAISMIKIFAKDKKRSALALALFGILPICINSIDIIASGTGLYVLTCAQLLLVFPFALKLLEETDGHNLMKWLVIIPAICIVFTYYYADSASHTAIKMTYNQAYSTTARIIDRMENTPGYRREMPVLFGGIIGDYNYSRSSTLYRYTLGGIVNNPVFHISYNGANGTWFKFIKIFFGLDIPMCTPEDYRNIVFSDEYRSMEIFPSENSVKIINGIVVVKLTEIPEMPF